MSARTAPTEQPTEVRARTDLVRAVSFAKRTGGWQYANDEGHLTYPCRPSDIPDDATAVYPPGPLVTRGSQYLRRLRRLSTRTKDTARRDRTDA